MKHTLMTLAAIALAGHAHAQVPDGYPETYTAMLETARGEGPLLVYTNMEPVQWEGAVELFNALLPEVEVQFLELNSGEIGARYQAEVASGQPSADLIVTTDIATWVKMMETDQITPYASPEASVYPAWSMPHPGLYTIAADPMMLMWNKALLPEDMVPDSMGQLAELAAENPQVFNGTITTYDATTPYGYNAHSAFVKFHGDKAWEWLDVLAPMTRPDGTGPMLEKVTTGEYALAYFMGAGVARLALKDPARAEIVGLAPIKDGNPIVLRGAAAPKTANSPESAKVMLDVLLSRDGQISLGKRARTPLRPDVTSADVDGGLTYAEVVAQIGEENMIPITFDAELASNETFDAFVARYRQATGR
ncbi:ABC transporter substrate-binding protein [Falsirhodobacter xinxiangensis]|uniref:ABC transporter substrate-binding protein n=1 Tax=Falsirhodobacter xinxiangensis TaxID=2530049 RepID=UPI00145AAB29|nr:extracellular solute-binding protein [Rhodobacter xinxiangensis]